MESEIFERECKMHSLYTRARRNTYTSRHNVGELVRCPVKNIYASVFVRNESTSIHLPSLAK